MEKGTNRDAVPPYSTFAAAENGACRPGAGARDGDGLAGRAAGGGQATGGMGRTQRGQPGV